MARDNSVKYNWRTLQLPPDGDRPTYAGVQVKVLEDLDRWLLVQYLGQTIHAQEAHWHHGAGTAMPYAAAT